MRRFWKDYVDLVKRNVGFVKEHLVGCVLVYVITIVASIITLIGWLYKDSLSLRFDGLIGKNSDVSEEKES
jgi:hypothetical protein